MMALAAFAAPAFALSPAQNNAVSTAYGNTKDKLTALAESTGWDADSAWIVLALARGGALTEEQAAAYYNNVAAQLKTNNSAVIDTKNSSTNSKTILALTAAGYDPSDVDGYNLLQPLSNLGYIRSQGMNGPVWALLAFDCNNYEIPVCDNPKAQTTRDNLISSILGTQHADGGWSFSMGSDVDMTCMVIQALAPYYDTNETVKAAVDRGLAWVSSAQLADGTFSSGGSVCSESASQVLVALTSLGIDPTADERFLKGGKGAIDALLSFYVQGGGFKHVEENYKYNVLASMQGLYALVAWYRFRDGQNSLYDMTDRDNGYEPDVSYEEEETPPDDPPAPPDDGSSDSEGGNGGSTDNGNADNKGAAADTKTPGGKTAGGSTKSAGKIGLKDSEKEKTPAQHVLEMAGKVLERKLPADGSKYTEADRIMMLDVYKAYQTLNEAEQLAVSKDEKWKKYMEAAAALGQAWHMDSASGVDLRSNDEKALPWHVRLVIDPYEADEAAQTSIANALGEGGSLQKLYDVHFINMLDNKPWTPEGIVNVRIPATGKEEGQTVVVHLAADGKVELLDCDLIEADGTSYASFSAAEFSPYGVASVSGSLDDMLAAGGQDSGLAEEVSGGGVPWLWIGLGGLGLAGLLLLLVMRRRADEEEGPQEDGTR